MNNPPLVPHLNSFSFPFFFFSFNQNSEVLYISPSVRHVLGFEPHEIIGRKLLSLLDPSSPLNADIESCLDSRFAVEGSHDRLRIAKSKDRESRVLRVHTFGGKDTDGNVVISYGIAQDVTESYSTKLGLENKLLELKQIYSTLSERERGVLADVSNGKLNKTVAQELDISERAVERIRSRLVKKFGVKSVAEVLVKATEYKLLDLILGTTRCSTGFRNNTQTNRNLAAQAERSQSTDEL